MTDDGLVEGDVDAGELEVGRREVVEDDVGVRVPAGRRLVDQDRGQDLVVDRQDLVDVDHRGGVLAERGRRHVQRAAADVEHAAVDREALQPAVVHVGGAQDVSLATGDVARLRVGRCAGLLLPQAVVLLGDEADLAVRLAVARCRDDVGVGGAGRVGALGLREHVQELEQGRRHLAADGRDAERRERNDVAVELADPVDQPVAAGVADEDVAAGATERPILVHRVRVGPVVEPGDASLRAGAVRGRCEAAGRQVVVGLEQVVAEAAPERVVTGAADDPVVAQVTEDDVVAVGVGDRVDQRCMCRSAPKPPQPLIAGPSLLVLLRKYWYGKAVIGELPVQV